MTNQTNLRINSETPQRAAGEFRVKKDNHMIPQVEDPRIFIVLAIITLCALALDVIFNGRQE
jgi:hypothetical protein